MAELTSPASRRPDASAWVLGLIVVVSAALRSISAWQHTIPRLFPDEYIYAALGRSIGHGHLQIRGSTVHFPGLLEPILAAPIWRLAPLTTAYHLVQVENAVAASLGAVPLYFLARSLHLSKRYSLCVALYGVLIPELVLVAFTSSDAVAYPFALTAIALGVRSLDQPTRRRQVGFLIFTSLATLARVQYFVIFPAYLAAALLVDRRAAWRNHRIALFAAAPTVGVFLIALFGFYTDERKTPFDATYVKWFFLQMFLLAVETGVVMAPGAVAALTRPRGRRELGFASFTAVLVLLLLAEATAHAADSSQFKERYLFLIIALVPVAFGLFVKNNRPHRFVVVGLSAAIVVAAARLPLSEYATATFKTDSQFLFAVSQSQTRFGAGNSSLVIALLATASACAAAVIAFRGNRGLPFAFAGAVALTASIVATRADVRLTQAVRARLPTDLRWVDHATRGPVTAIETPQAVKQDLLYQLYWNTAIWHERLLGSANATDAFSAPRVRIGRNGVLKGVSGEVLFHDFGATGWFANAQRVAHVNEFTLWRSRGPARFRLIIEGRFWDGWLGVSGRLRAWPDRSGSGVRVRFRLSLPQEWQKGARVRLGETTFAIRPGGSVNVTCISGRGPLDLAVSGSTSAITKGFRHVSARLTGIAISDHRPSASPTRICSAGK